MREEIIATIPQDDAEVTLEVALVHTDTNHACIELRHLVWGGTSKNASWIVIDGESGNSLACR